MAGPGASDGNGITLATLATQVVAAVVAALVSIGFVAFVGAVVLWSRFEAAKLPADQAVAVQPEADLVTVGAIALVFFVLGGVLAVLLLALLSPKGEATFRTRTGLIVIIALEIAAGYLVEDWDALEGLALIGVAAVGLLGLYIVVELAAGWVTHHKEQPTRSFFRRGWAVFRGKVDEVKTWRLWGTLLLLTVAVAALAALSDELIRDAVGDGPISPDVIRHAVGGGLLLIGFIVALLPYDSQVERRWARFVAGVALIAASATLLIKGSAWLAAVAGIAVLLGAANLAVAHVTKDKFPVYGVVAFVSVAVFGAAFTLVRGLGNPQAQGVALLRTNDAQPFCGIFVAETDDRLYYGRVDGKGTGDERQLIGDSGRLLWVARDRLAAAELGPLEEVAEAQDTAVQLRRELALGVEPHEVGAASRVTVPGAGIPSADGRDPCGPRIVSTEPPSTPEREQAARYQPRLILSARDGFWPVSVLTLYDLKWRGRKLCREPGCSPVASTNDLPFTGGVNQWLEYPGSNASVGRQHDIMVRALPSPDPYRSARQYFLTAENRDSGTTSLQYWYFYTFNYQPLRVGQAGFHEGDFEHVGVLLSREGTPRAVWMARHDDEGQVLLWGEPALRTRGEHADVYVARGSHASYESCIEQQRRRAPLGFINDRPECGGARQIVLEPGQVPLYNLAHARWACWGGRFGHVEADAAGSEWRHVEANGPKSPLHQQDYDGVTSAPCRDLDVPREPPAEGEEPLPADAARQIRSGAGRLDALVDECEDWQRPQSQGSYVAACAPGALGGWVKTGMPDGAAPGLNVLAPGDRPRPDRMPIAVRRDAKRPSFAGWRLRAAARDEIVVYASCYAGRTPLEATFRGVTIEPGGQLRLDDSGWHWRILDAADRTVAKSTPRIPGEADGPSPPKDRPASTRCR